VGKEEGRKKKKGGRGKTADGTLPWMCLAAAEKAQLHVFLVSPKGTALETDKDGKKRKKR